MAGEMNYFGASNKFVNGVITNKLTDTSGDIWLSTTPGTGQVGTQNNLLDDGFGNMFVSGRLYADPIVDSNGDNWLSNDNAGTTYIGDNNDNYNGIFMTVGTQFGGINFQLSGYPMTTSGGNTLDDSNGNMTIAGVLQVNLNGNIPGGMTIYNTVPSPCFTVDSNSGGGNGTVTTYANTLDDGSGNLTANTLNANNGYNGNVVTSSGTKT